MTAGSENTLTYEGCSLLEEEEEGIVADIYRSAHREYHYMMKYINNNEDTLHKQRMMMSMLGNDQRNFW